MPMRRLSPRIFFAPFGVFQELWSDGESLLHIHVSLFSEYHRRFELRDIQAISIGRSARRALYTVVLAACLLPALTPLFLANLAEAGPGWLAFWAIPPMLLLLLLVLNLALGPTCVCRVHTAVQVETLGSFTRLRRAQALLESLKPQIEAAQGGSAEAYIQQGAAGANARQDLAPPGASGD